MRAQPARHIPGDPAAMQRAALRREERIAERARFQIAIALYGLGGLIKLKGIAALLKPLAVFLGVIVRVARYADEAARIEMARADVLPQLVPGRIGLRNRISVTARGTIGAADDAVMIARGCQRIGNRPLLDQRHRMTGLGQRPGAGQSGNSCSDDGDFHDGVLL